MWGRGRPEAARATGPPRQFPLVRRARTPGAALTILDPAPPLLPAAPAAPAEAAATPWAAAGSRSRRRHFPPPGSRESGGGACARRPSGGRGLRSGRSWGAAQAALGLRAGLVGGRLGKTLSSEILA